MDTKELILHTATNLFNQHGTAKISANAIAEAAGISSGNLYYHYKDKSHILREIYEQMIRLWEKPYSRAENRSLSIETFRRFIERQLKILQQAEKDGIFHFPEPDVRLDEVLTIAWIIANHYLVHLESMGQVVEYRDFENGTNLILKVLRPYMI